MSRKTYSLDELTKVEGHAKLHVELDGKTVKRAELSVFEPSRYFEALVIGKSYQEVPSISQRICGICSVVHTVTSIKAIENAMGVKISKQTADLRRLLLCSSTIHSHTAHLFFFAAPDYLGFDDVIELARKKREYLDLAIELQRLSSGIVKTIGGRSLHPVTPCVGGFHSVPKKADISNMIRDFERIKDLSVKAAKMFMSFRPPKLENRTEYLGLAGKGEYPLYDGEISALASDGFRPEDYMKNIEEEVIFRSSAKYTKFRGKPYMVGALSRLNNNHEYMSSTAKGLLKRSGLHVPCYSPFMNNFAQSLELVHFSDVALDLLRRYEENGMKEERIDIKPRKGEGFAACEAPRGILIHHYRFDSNGKAAFANIITPTCQNVRNMEYDMQKLIPAIVNKPDSKVKRILEMLIRAYDPCFSCSTHFLDLDIRKLKKH
ncbi:MAG: Ni/Fe hydrogenase subunit alpha [Candidatus Aenigmarchaeota archaeon]|nr:Ni/Fe hydrogenase subunit alpha [Candidatus Aenigmarchaeota archaeon]